MAGGRLLRCVAMFASPICWAQLVVDLGVGDVSGAVRPRPLVAPTFNAAAAEPSRLSEPTVALQHPTICDPDVKQYSGYFTIHGTGFSPETRYFFWLFESRRNPDADPLVLWLNGGPGCSSMAGLFEENGPCRVDTSGTGTINNPFSWTASANVMWVDQPSGVGFSTGPAYVHSETQVGAAMYGFLQQLFANTELKKFAMNDFFVFGESYGGHYVPAVAHRIWSGNQQREGAPINLKGLGIGNGMTVPSVQFGYYEQMAADGGLEFGGSLHHGVLDAADLRKMRDAMPVCLKTAHDCDISNEKHTCLLAFQLCLSTQLQPYIMTGLSPYNMRQMCKIPPLCSNTSNVIAYLNSPEVQAQIGVHKSWTECSSDVLYPFLGEWMERFDGLLPDMLASGVRALIYAGDVDYICNWLGNKAWTLSMKWPHQDRFTASSDEPLLLDGSMVGRVRTTANLSFVQVFGAGHMVPSDQPATALNMFETFLSNRFEDTRLDGSGFEAAKTLLAVPNRGPAPAAVTTVAPMRNPSATVTAKSVGFAPAYGFAFIGVIAGGMGLNAFAILVRERWPRSPGSDGYIRIQA
eukprot:TRINITY_DN6500_c0_g1_i1.p1 TRINITY_DN6500_c0_g1~~TRINITY_DN6500_c0_g1_i1.p1  ORF type:complete len:603 (-),score=53.94 TRINITY_DN6500_c0_g1_i1:38-1771(-)